MDGDGCVEYLPLSKDMFDWLPWMLPKYIAVVYRGFCSFDTKALNAAKSGYKGLIIINSDSSSFPVGSSNEDFVSRIPVVMIGNDSFRFLDSDSFHLKDSSMEIQGLLLDENRKYIFGPVLNLVFDYDYAISQYQI